MNRIVGVEATTPGFASNNFLYIYYTAFSFFRMGRAAAMAVFAFVILMIFSLIQLRIFRSADQ